LNDECDVFASLIIFVQKTNENRVGAYYLEEQVGRRIDPIQCSILLRRTHVLGEMELGEKTKSPKGHMKDFVPDDELRYAIH
jgi:hypothetical protein